MFNLSGFKLLIAAASVHIATLLRWRSNADARRKLQLVRTILCNHCCARASKLHAQRRKSPRQSLTIKPNMFAQRIAVARKTRAKYLKHFFSLYNCCRCLEICTEVGEWETNVFTYSRYDWILVTWRFRWPAKAFRMIKWLLRW